MNDRRPTTPERGRLLDEGETPGDEIEKFPTHELTMAELEELKAATGLEQFKIGKMFKSGRQRQQDTAKLWNELQRIEKEGPAAAAERRRQIRNTERIAEEAEAAKQRRMEEAKAEAAKQRRMEEAKAEAAKQRRMEEAKAEAAKQRRMEEAKAEAAKQRRMEEAEAAKQRQRPHLTAIEYAYIHGEPRAQLIENLKHKFGYGGRRRSKKSDITKKYKTRSKSRSRISTKRKNKNRRQTRK